MALNKSDLYSSLWASCDELRGGMDASQYKDYVLFMLFIKYITDKWMTRLSAAVHGELDRVSQTLTGRIREFADRYATPLPQLTFEVAALAARVDEHLKKMGATP
jgi:type I restriction enzyme M protein